jgi:hypothetical protein
MAADDSVYLYVVFDATALLGTLVKDTLSLDDIADPVWRLLQQTGTGLSQTDYTISSVPLVMYHSGHVAAPRPDPYLQEVFSVTSPSAAAAQRFRDAVDASIRSGNKAFRSVDINPLMTVTEYSVPVAPDATVFGTLEDAQRLIRSDRLRSQSGLTGESVNVVVIDAGFNKDMIPPAQFGGGWQLLPQGPGLPIPPAPGATTGEDALHGTMIVNAIRALAPDAMFFDVPLIPPPKIYDIFSFLHAADAAYGKILHDIQSFRSQGAFLGPWIFMNAWAIYDRRSELPFLGEYTENLGSGGGLPHYFIRRIEQVAKARFDIVFCAGNCGEVCPDDRCGPNDYGPGRGIWGANAHRDVLTVGAVRVDAMWPGYSSEGPGPRPHLYGQKPDLCAPSQFIGAAGLYPPNSGTSAAAAVVAGVLSALRSAAGWNQARVPPYILKLILNNTAMQIQGLGWNRWLGNGILDAYAAYQQLQVSFP